MTSTDRSTPARRGVVAAVRRRLTREETVSAVVAVGVVLVARFALGLLALIGSAIGFSATSFPSGFLATPVGQFLGSFVLYPFPFYLAAAIVLIFVSPLATDAPLAAVLRSGAIAGAIGTAALAVVGIAPGVLLSISGNTWANLALYLTTIPLSNGIVDTALLLVGCVLSWLWARRERDRLGADPGEYVPRPRRSRDVVDEPAVLDVVDEGPAVVTGDPDSPTATTEPRGGRAASGRPRRPEVDGGDPTDQSRFAPPEGL
ncbi:hypothetical protein ACPEEZ_05135 [Frigoribacterium sp. 2-23]|uniref:hypothetical protein n=1 Tax=Frigoribacterium sp. 2-23 TaxID=3415006 RepID=UPI003C6F0EF9